MKYLFLLALLAFPFSANAQTALTKEQTDSYFTNCLKASEKDNQFSPESEQVFCACTAGRLTQYFTLEDMQTMTSQTDPNARVAMNKMIINIYAPCMETPARDKYQSICAQNPQVNQNVCKCTANKIGMHMQQNGSQIFADILANNPTIEDPWAMLEKDPQFEAFKESAAKSCI